MVLVDDLTLSVDGGENDSTYGSIAVELYSVVVEGVGRLDDGSEMFVVPGRFETGD